MSINCVTESYIYMFFRFFFLFSIWQFWSSIEEQRLSFFFFFKIIIFMQIKLELDQEDKDPA